MCGRNIPVGWQHRPQHVHPLTFRQHVHSTALQAHTGTRVYQRITIEFFFLPIANIPMCHFHCLWNRESCKGKTGPNGNESISPKTSIHCKKKFTWCGIFKIHINGSHDAFFKRKWLSRVWCSRCHTRKFWIHSPSVKSPQTLPLSGIRVLPFQGWLPWKHLCCP